MDEQGSKNDDISERFLRGDEESIAEVLGRICPSVMRRLTHRFYGRIAPDEAEHIVLCALMSAWQKRTMYQRSKGTFGGWLWSIANHLALDFARMPVIRARRRQVMANLLELADTGSIRPSRNDEGRIASSTVSRRRDVVERALSKLPARIRLVVLADANSPDGRVATADLARDLRLAPATIRAYRQRGRQKLKNELERLGIRKMLLRATPET